MSIQKFKKVYLEISNICNLQCTFCPEVEREKKQLDSEKFKNYLSQVSPFAERICLHVMGEPLNHPQFCEFVKLAEEHNVSLEITTNGTLLNEQIQSALLNPCVNQVNFSIQSFLDNFPVANPQTYFDKIFNFCEKANETRPDLYINLRLWNIKDAGDNNNEVFFRALEKRFSLSINRTVHVDLNKSKKLFSKVYLHFDSRFEWPNINNTINSTRGTCHGTRSHLAVHADGTVVPCCLDKEANIKLGNINQQNFKDILTTERYLNMKSGFENLKLVEDLCQRCTYIDRFN